MIKTIDVAQQSTTTPASDYLSQKLLGAVLLIALVFVALAPALYCRLTAPRKVVKLNKEMKALSPSATDDTKSALTDRIAAWQMNGKMNVLGAIMGDDKRLSTSKTIAAVWTLVVAYILLTLIVVWPPDWGKALTNLQGPYLALLGGPVATLVLSKTIVSTRVRRGTLQKSEGDGIPRLTDLVGDDNGDTDLFDLQYVLFNLIAIIFVLYGFWRATLDGFPVVPTTLWLLTGGPAAVFVSNKAFGTNAPEIFSVDPARVRRNEKVAIYGQNFSVAGQATSATSPFSVQIDGVKASVDAESLTSSSVVVTVPTDLPSDDAVVLTVITDAGVQVNRSGLLTVVDDPTIEPVAAGQQVSAGGTVTLTGAWNPQPGGLTVLVGGVSAATSNATASAVNVTVPANTPAGPVDVVVIDAVGRSEPVKLVVG